MKKVKGGKQSEGFTGHRHVYMYEGSYTLNSSQELRVTSIVIGIERGRFINTRNFVTPCNIRLDANLYSLSFSILFV